MSRFSSVEADILMLAELRRQEREKQEECEHEFDPDEGYHCLNCGKDGTEDVMSAAYDRAKDLRKYGP